MWLLILMVQIIFYENYLLTNTQAPRIWESFGNRSLANTNFSKTQLSKMVHLGRPPLNLIDLLG